MSNIQTFTGDGVTTSFYFTFPFFGTDDINVSVGGIPQTTDNYTLYPTQTPAPADTQYTGGRIDFAIAPENGAVIKVWRKVELARHIDYQPTAQPQSHQLNQDINQCIEILKEMAETLTNTLSIATVPTLENLLSEMTTIQNTLDTFATKTTVNTLSNTVSGHTGTLTTLGNTVDGHTTAIGTLAGYDYVVESQLPTADNNYTWYRKYKSGWIEQGGYYSGNSDAVTVTLPKTMQDAYYTINALADNYSGISGSYTMVDTATQTTTGFKIVVNFNGTTPSTKTFRWYICGVAA